MSEIYGTFSTAYVEAMRLRLSALEPENKDLRARVAELEEANRSNRVVMGGLSAVVDAWKDHCNRLEEVGDMIVAEYMVVEPEKSAWQQAKEAKP